MTKKSPPPLYAPIVDGSGIATIPWTLFFNESFIGDTGTEWTPTFQNLTEVGSATITGRYYKITQNLVYFRVTITPATSTSSTAGTTYIDNFPLAITGDGYVLGVAPSSGVGVGLGVAVANNGRIYPPSWTGATIPVVLNGMMEVQ